MEQTDINRLYGRRSANKKKTRTKLLAILSLSALPGALLLPLSMTDSKLTLILAWVALITNAAFFIISSKKTLTMVLSGILIFFLVNATGSPLLPALLLTAVVPAALAASVAGISLWPAWALLPLSFGLSFLLTDNLYMSASAPLLLLPGLILTLFKRKNGEKKAALICASLPMILSLAAAVALTIYIYYGNLAPETLILAIKQITDELVVQCKPYFLDLGFPDNQVVNDELRAMIASCINILPGLAVASALVISHLTDSMQNRISSAMPVSDQEPDKTPEKLSISIYASLMFLICYILSFGTSPAGTESLAAIVATNLGVMLAPAMLYAGADSLQSLSKRGPGGFLTAVLILLAAFIGSGIYAISLLHIFALIGSAGILLTTIDRWAKEYYGKGENL